MMTEGARKDWFTVGFELHTSHQWVIQNSKAKNWVHLEHCILNGAAARTCQIGDQLIIVASEYIDRKRSAISILSF